MNSHSHSDHHNAQHITPFNTYIKVAAALLFLTFLTVFAHSMREHLGVLAPFIAFGIAIVKASLVILWFMHLKYDTWINRAACASAFLFLLLLFTVCAIDIGTRVIETNTL